MILVSMLGFILIIIGLWGMLTQKNIIKMIIGFSIIDTGIHLVIVSIGYLKDRTAPILDAAVEKATAVERVVDPVPSALVLTAIVIGLAVTALMLVYAVQMYKHKKSLQINDFEELKW
ncbi:MAG: sodium:proton antiporter [Candidatus Cloacimonetes bacterium]|nr:sodium:proton antiporter [Candidatus Cloacimonadota bacterium]MCF7813515.1 sodium:proton antiporter [Candidatus Cloacimonadota bacterium]MCF7868701.1 sodium:proton antiporter [Candidatus Cloacimonadota bacterium]MCF7884667.1 sodium:proton antiporter [Candidatus Cloacimonadota bacterium]